jgi:branched-chain amino acid transport system substrate-binding protein
LSSPAADPLPGRRGSGRTLRRAALLTVASIIAVAGCGSSGKSDASAGPSGGASARTYTVGVIVDLTGALGATNKGIPTATKAGVITAKAEGYTIRTVVVDGQSTPAGELAAAHKLVDQDHVLAVIINSDLTFTVAPYLTQQGVPVIGGAVDSTEWNTSANMFSIFGFPDYSKVTTTSGELYKALGATNVGAVGYGRVPSSKLSAEGIGAAATNAGLKAGYLNTTVALGSTDIGPLVLGMKNAGIDGVALQVQETTAFDVIRGLREQGVNLRAPVLSIGYGDSLLSSGPATIADAQDVYFTLGWEPVEMHTAATEKFVSALKEAGTTAQPGLPEYMSYASVDALVWGLKGAGADPTRASLISALSKITNYDGAGLLGSHTISFAMADRGKGGPGADNCLWVTLFKGNTFSLVKGADPVCGTVISGKTVS